MPIVQHVRQATEALTELRSRPKVWLPAAVLSVGVLTQLILSIHLVSDSWFVRDDWEFLMKRGTIADADRGWLAPYGSHWVTGAVVIFRVLFAIFGMRYYLPYVLVCILIHLAITVLLYGLLVRAGSTRWIALATAWIVLFLGAGAEAFLWDGPMTLMGSMLMGMVSLYVCQRTQFSERGVIVASVVLALGVLFSGTGLVMACVAAAFAMFQRSIRVALRLLAPPVVLFGVWFAFIGHSGASALDDKSVYLQIPTYVWTGITAALGNASGVPGSGPVFTLVLIVAAFTVQSAPEPLRNLAWAGVIGAVLQMTLAAIARLFAGIDQAASGRYAYLIVVFLAPSVAICLVAVHHALLEPRWVPALLAAALLLGYTVNGVDLEQRFGHFRDTESRDWPQRMRGIMASADAGERVLTPSTGKWWEGDVDARLATRQPIRDAMPKGAATPTGRLDAESMFFVGVGPQTYGLFAPAEVELRGFSAPFEPGNKCSAYQATQLDPSLVLTTGSGNELGIKSASTKVTTQLQRGDLTSDPREWDVQPGEVHIASSAKGAKLVVTFDRGGEFIICTN